MLRRSGRVSKKAPPPSDSDNEDIPRTPSLKIGKKKKSKLKITDSSSSSESDIENYLQPPDKIDLNSSFFDTKKSNNVTTFDVIEKEIFSGTNIPRLSESDSSDEELVDVSSRNTVNINEALNQTNNIKSPEVDVSLKEEEKVAKLNFQRLEDYTRRIEEAKKSVEEYEAKQAQKNKTENEPIQNQQDIEVLLAVGETKFLDKSSIPSAENSDSFEAHSDSDRESWEEICEAQDVHLEHDKKELVPDKELQITVDMPTTVKKKKGDDFLSAIKRRLNRIRKENQILIHKVHLLCWIAHGNYVNEVLSDPTILGLGLSLIPSEKCYPSGRIDLEYLEQILKWFRKTIKLVEKVPSKSKSLNALLSEQIDKKEAYTKKMLVLIFLVILRSLGIYCRLVLSLQVEPLRPPSKDLHFLGNSSENKKTGKSSKSSEKKTQEESLSDNVFDSKKETDTVNKSKVSGSSKNEKTDINKKKLSKDIPKTNNISKKDEKPTTEKIKDNEKNLEQKSSKRKVIEKKVDSKTSTSSAKRIAHDPGKTIRSKSTSSPVVKLERIDDNHSRIRSKSSSSVKTTRKLNQLDGSDDTAENNNSNNSGRVTRSQTVTNSQSFEDFYSRVYDNVSQKIKTRSSLKIPQLDGVTDEASTSKPNIKKLKNSVPSNEDKQCKSRRHKTVKKPNYLDRDSSDSDDYFTESPTKIMRKNENKNTTSKITSKVNLKKLKDSPHSHEKKTKDVTKDIMQLIKGRIAEQKQIDKRKMVNKKKKKHSDVTSDDSDYVPEVLKKKYDSDSDDEFHPKMKVKQRIKVKNEVKKVIKLKKPKDANSRKVISSDSEYTEEEIRDVENSKQDIKKKKGNDTWLEVFLETEEKWISVDVIFGQVHCVNELHSRASAPVSYVLGWTNNNILKDITRRYCQNFNTVTRKLRIDSQWWEESLKPFLGPNNARDKEEDDELNRQQLEKPLPTTISEYKNHPLYALERHLLKFEALYPPNAPPLGYVRNEPVYSRDCVHVCHSRDIWLKQAKVVKLKEKPYKIVKARPKYDKLSNTMITDQNLEIFGPWQVQDYDPPTAENGIVPRNAFGNVDLFKPSMLPKKCVHLQLAGLNKIARRMNIDCATAIVGFDFHGGWSHPVYDGFVVCEEYEKELIAAWEVEQEEIERKEQEKYEKRVYTNWKKLIKGLLIRERLKAKYGFGKEGEGSSSHISGGKRKSKSKPPTFCTKKRRVISDSSDSEEEKR